MLRPADITMARRSLGYAWGLGRSLTCEELGVALEFTSERPGQVVAEMERKVSRITGPVSVAISAMLAGYVPQCAPAGAPLPF